MRRSLTVFACSIVFLSAVMPVVAADPPVTRRDGFLLIWKSIRRPVEANKEKEFTDLPRSDRGGEEITYAKTRAIIDDEAETFRPDEPLKLEPALLWLFRTRSVADMDDMQVENLPDLLEKYPLGKTLVTAENGDRTVIDKTLTQEELLSLMRLLDAQLREEIHETSFYSEKFHGKGTAFGEAFDMYAMTAAHRTFPKNTLVEVTSVETGKTVTVRINDRGPYVDGRDMDLSYAAFLVLAPRSKGKLDVRFRRLGDANLVGFCEGAPYAIRLGRKTRMQPGIPYALPLGQELSLGADAPFVVRSVKYPDGVVSWMEDWIIKDQRFLFKPSIVGEYVFRLSSKTGETREVPMKVVDCSL